MSVMAPRPVRWAAPNPSRRRRAAGRAVLYRGGDFAAGSLCLVLSNGAQRVAPGVGALSVTMWAQHRGAELLAARGVHVTDARACAATLATRHGGTVRIESNVGGWGVRFHAGRGTRHTGGQTSLSSHFPGPFGEWPKHLKPVLRNFRRSRPLRGRGFVLCPDRYCSWARAKLVRDARFEPATLTVSRHCTVR